MLAILVLSLSLGCQEARQRSIENEARTAADADAGEPDGFCGIKIGDSRDSVTGKVNSSGYTQRDCSLAGLKGVVIVNFCKNRVHRIEWARGYADPPIDGYPLPLSMPGDYETLWKSLEAAGWSAGFDVSSSEEIVIGKEWTKGSKSRQQLAGQQSRPGLKMMRLSLLTTNVTPCTDGL